MKGEDRISLLPDCLIVEILSRLGDIKYAIRTGKLVLLNVSSVIEVELAYYQAYFTESMKLVDETNEEILQDFLLSVGHVKEVIISESILQTLAGLKAKGFTFPWNLKVLGEIDSN
ncbi:hypothetical protein Tco_1575448 [Tanacetum coccineum]